MSLSACFLMKVRELRVTSNQETHQYHQFALFSRRSLRGRWTLLAHSLVESDAQKAPILSGASRRSILALGAMHWVRLHV